MRDVVALFVHSIVTIVRLAEPGGLRAVVAESVLVKHQLLILNRGRKRAESKSFGSHHRRFMCFVHAPSPDASVSHRREAVHSVEFSRNAQDTKV